MRGIRNLTRWQAVLAGLAVALLGGIAAVGMTTVASRGTDARALVVDGDCPRSQREDRRCTVYIEFEGERTRLASGASSYPNGRTIDIVVDSNGRPDKVGTVAGQRAQGLLFGVIGAGGLLFAIGAAIFKR